ncbi:aryl-alcohol dehydrogenase-like predicted oxidoreductase [Mariniflexile fucanivorans]|uniref:Aryl-alcohol dehydrogenase-like predicted oxidoreductase n=1 Tax=Mariniflexile fucanivorans TaxID=264023 RepID=A0A4R1RHG1_9FLAO|nr:aldo/keto reductase [Mariniflexile fucanivorans]TCL65369.1 aryl-alcohol dehydrogenase-like predicted oxidoreductase [Mariniflexile fucanivorans]
MNLGLGMAAIGRLHYINVRTNTVAKSDVNELKANGFKVLDEAYNLGVRYFDTAPGYGLAEDLLIEWLTTKNDKSIKVATKWGYTYTANFDKNATVHEVKEHSISKLKEQWQVSKKLLPFLTTYQIHSATLETGVLENESVLNELAYLKSEFNLKMGISTTGENQVEVIKKALDVVVEGKSLFDTFQSTYNILDQSILSIADTLKQEGKKLILKETLANGRIFRNSNYPKYADFYNVLESLSKKYGVGVDAIALQFCAKTIPESMVLSGASTVTQLQENLKVGLFVLTEDELNQLKSFEVKPTWYWNERKELQWN